MWCNCSNLEAKTLNYDLLRVCAKIGWRCFLIFLQNSLIVYYNVFLWTPYKSAVLCSSSSLSNLCNDIAPAHFPLNGYHFSSRLGFNLLYKNLNVMYFNRVHFINSFSVHKSNNKRSTNPYIDSWLHILLSLCPILS